MSKPTTVTVDGRLYTPASQANRYVDHLLKLRCAPLLLTIGWTSKPSKEISESMAAREAALRHITAAGIDRGDPSVLAVCIADGTSSRTGALLACTTAWQVHAVDPIADPARTEAIDRLTVHPELLDPGALPDAERVVIVAVHSHAPWATVGALAERYPSGVLVAMPCCVALPDSVRPGAARVEDSHDIHCMSEARRVVVERWGHSESA